MRLSSLLLLLTLTFSGCGGDEAKKTAASEAVLKTQPEVEPEGRPPKTPVKGAKLLRQGFDRDGDGKIETWQRRDSEGHLIEERDTDGDGIADVTTRIVVQKGQAPGISVQPVEEKTSKMKMWDGREVPEGMTPIK